MSQNIEELILWWFSLSCCLRDLWTWALASCYVWVDKYKTSSCPEQNTVEVFPSTVSWSFYLFHNFVKAQQLPTCAGACSAFVDDDATVPSVPPTASLRPVSPWRIWRRHSSCTKPHSLTWVYCHFLGCNIFLSGVSRYIFWCFWSFPMDCTVIFLMFIFSLLRNAPR